jgi:hypothetical protein
MNAQNMQHIMGVDEKTASSDHPRQELDASSSSSQRQDIGADEVYSLAEQRAIIRRM